MAGKLYVDEIRDVAGTGSPAFPNGLGITELTDPVGSEGDVLTVQADGSILAAATAGAGIPISVSGIADRSDATEVGTAVLAALTPLTWSAAFFLDVYVSETDGANLSILQAYDDSGLTWVFSTGNMTGAGTVLVWGIRIST